MQYLGFASAYAHHDRLGLIVAGGRDAGSGANIQNVQRTFDAIFFDDLEDAPTDDFAYGCMTILNGSTLYVAPGSGDDQLYEYNMMTSTWTSMGDIPSGGRNHLGCGVAKNRLGQTEIIIAGGLLPEDDVSVDIYNLDTSEWKTSSKLCMNIFSLMLTNMFADNSLPIPKWGMASVPYGDTFLLVGGYNENSGDYLETIYVFEPFSETFNLVQGVRLKTARRLHTAFFVDAMSFPECT